MTIRRRPVEESDRPFLLELYASSRETELAPVPWTAEQKRAFLEMQFAAQTKAYQESYPGATHEIVCVEGRPAGRLYLSRQPAEFHILDLLIVAEARSQGVGSRVLAEILQEANQAGKPVTIYVESFNPWLNWFRRLGFGVASEHEFLLLLQHPPAPSGPLESGNSMEADPPGD